MARLWRNFTDIPDDKARAIYEAVLPPGLSAHDVAIKNCGGGGYRGMAYAKGSSLHLFSASVHRGIHREDRKGCARACRGAARRISADVRRFTT